MLEVLLAAVILSTEAGTCEAPAPDNAPALEACESGGWGARTCSALCHRVFNFWTTSCAVSCRSGYYACCSCEAGCKCVMDHDEMWPAPGPTPEPVDPVPVD